MESNMSKEMKVLFRRCLNPGFKIILANQGQMLTANYLLIATIRHACTRGYS